MDHLVCFMPGTIALGTTGGLTVLEAKKRGLWSKSQETDLNLAKELLKTCIGMYKVTETGLAPEIAFFHIKDPVHMMADGALSGPREFAEDPDAEWRQDYIIKPGDAHNLQRPETVESLFYMYRITGDEMYREVGWTIFEAFVKHTAVPDDGGFSSIGDVNHIPPPTRDNMESFWLVSHFDDRVLALY